MEIDSVNPLHIEDRLKTVERAIAEIESLVHGRARMRLGTFFYSNQVCLHIFFPDASELVVGDEYVRTAGYGGPVGLNWLGENFNEEQIAGTVPEKSESFLSRRDTRYLNDTHGTPATIVVLPVLDGIDVSHTMYIGKQTALPDTSIRVI
ncbi:hypothetical protein VTN77DRAFT_9890 [Rasamsonia byssochlamydoides]|uniref:uncharacterized protein n=1 Tax=Rasamsonia byssochlamydoides TaxID=89139 RepID=UPI0037436144